MKKQVDLPEKKKVGYTGQLRTKKQVDFLLVSIRMEKTRVEWKPTIKGSCYSSVNIGGA